MTMNTRVHIAKPVSAEGLFLHVLDILESDPTFVPAWDNPASAGPFNPTPGPLRRGKATYSHKRRGETVIHQGGEKAGQPILNRAGETRTYDDSEFTTTLGQGLGAIWEVTYGDDGPLNWPPLEWREDGEEPEPESLPVHFVSANLDTAYGYSNGGAGCGDLHAFLLREIGAWLDASGADEWAWLHEERGTWHRPDEIALRGNADLAAAAFGRA